MSAPRFPRALATALLGCALAIGLAWAQRPPRTPSPARLGWCNDVAPPAPIAHRATLRLVRGAGVSEQEALDQLGRATAYYARHGIALERDGAIEAIEDRWMVGGQKDAIDAALRAKGIDPDTPAGARAPLARQVVCKVALAPLERFLRAAAPGRLHVVVLRHIAEPRSTAAGMLPHLRGLTVATGDASDLVSCLGVRETPTLLVGLDPVARRKPGTQDVTLAHELGHAFGLEHTTRQGDLMRIDPPACVPALTIEQRGTARRSRWLAGQ